MAEPCYPIINHLLFCPYHQDRVIHGCGQRPPERASMYCRSRDICQCASQADSPSSSSLLRTARPTLSYSQSSPPCSSRPKHYDRTPADRPTPSADVTSTTSLLHHVAHVVHDPSQASQVEPRSGPRLFRDRFLLDRGSIRLPFVCFSFF